MRGMYTEAILKLIAERPGIRAVEIADKIDCEVDAVERSISEQIESGYVRHEVITAPNGRLTPAFWMKDVQLEVAPVALKAPRVPKVEVSTPVVALTAEDLPVQADAPAAPGPEAPPAPVASVPGSSRPPAAPPARTKVDIAMEFIRNQPDHTASDDDFRALLGLRKDQHPSVYLSTQRRKGLIHKDIDVWRLGPRKSAADHPSAEPVSQIAEQPGAAEFRCALWSDGELQLARGEQIAMRLTAAEVGRLCNYLRLAA
jgi:hypothetical protein